MNDKSVDLDITKDCCPTWPCLVDAFGWMVAQGEEDRRIMPHIDHNSKKWRINYCPSCGAERRNVVNRRNR